MKHTVQTHQNILKALYSLKPRLRKALLLACDDKEINCICECIFNILQGTIPLKEKEKSTLKKHKSTLRKLVTKGKPAIKKHILIQKGGAFLPLILGSILSTLLSSLIK